MLTSHHLAVVVFSGLLFLAQGAGAMPGLEGVVKDASGRPLAGAEIRIETPETGSVLKVAKTDARGRYQFGGLRADIYRVSLVSNSQVKASIKNVQVFPTDPTQLNFELKQGKVTPQAKGKHFVWVPSSTGSNVAGRWVEVDEKGNINTGVSEQTRRNIGGAIVKRIQDNSGGNTRSR